MNDHLEMMGNWTTVPPWHYTPVGPYDVIVSEGFEVRGRFHGPEFDDAVRIAAEDGLPPMPGVQTVIIDAERRLIFGIYRGPHRIEVVGCQAVYDKLAEHFDPIRVLDWELQAKVVKG